MVYGDYPSRLNVNKILVVKMRHLGDVLLTTPVFTALKKAIPEAQVDAYIYEEAKPMLEGHPAISDLIGYDRQWKKLGLWERGLKEGAILREIRRRRYDWVINLTEGDRGVLAAGVSGAKVRIGFEPKGRWQKKLYTHRVKHCPGVRHAVERNLDALRCLGVFPSPEERSLFFAIPEEAHQSVRRKVGQEPFILIHPTSRWRFKCWPISQIRFLVQKLLEKQKKVVLTSGPDPLETAMIEEIGRGLDVSILAGQISLKELGALIEQSELLICVDSVPLHIASALQKRVVAIFGPTSDQTWGPWRNPQARVVAQKISCRPCYQDGCGGSKYSDCLHTLSVEQVLEAILTPV